MRKDDIAEALLKEVPGLSKRRAVDFVEVVIELMKETLSRGETIKFSGFGVFSTKQKPTRVGRNPQTGELIEITARTVLRFRPSDVLKKKLNPPDKAEGFAVQGENREGEDRDRD